MFYVWVKAIHVISIITWMAGMLYLLRLFVYHAMETEAVVRERFQVMERRLLKAIATPSMIATFITGITMLVLVPDWLKQPWMHVKLTCVLALAGVHGMSSAWRKRLITEPTFKTHKFFRVWNEVPTLLMVIIVIMVIRRPFGP
ncbi:MAG: protoporphyrinogen oxidase HemJ [Myxococcales bacterium]|nr:protoporphyrinogen oxidase HemJ [Myxococcales bacterium]